MKKYVLAIVLLMVASSASAVTFTWTNPTENTGKVDGTKIYMDAASKGAVVTVGPTATTATVADPTDGKCHNYWARAYKGTVESANSTVAVWCPAAADPPAVIQPPVTIGGFKITTTVTPVQ